MSLACPIYRNEFLEYRSMYNFVSVYRFKFVQFFSVGAVPFPRASRAPSLFVKPNKECQLPLLIHRYIC